MQYGCSLPSIFNKFDKAVEFMKIKNHVLNYYKQN